MATAPATCAAGQKLSVTHQTAIAGVVIPMTNVMTPLTAAQIFSTFKTDYCGNIIYENGNVSRILTEEGYITFSGTTPVYHYYLKDHQGNNRVVINQSGTVEQVNHYYPFGGLMGESTAGGVQPYKYNGKELDRMHGLDLFDYGARHYDAAIGRWHSVDPLAEKYYSISPYAYVANNPIRFIDPDGRDPIYAKNFWGKVKLIGDDGKNSTGSYLVRGSVAREVKAATKAGEFYTGDLSENKKVMHIPTGQKLEGVKQSYEDTKISQKENGGHSNIGDANVTRWDEGPAAITFTDKDGNQGAKASLQMFVVKGKNTMPADASNVEMWWHTHPNTTVNGISLGNSTPSDADYSGQKTMTNRGYKGNTFVIGVRSSTVTFFNKDGALTTVKWADFLRMGGQKE